MLFRSDVMHVEKNVCENLLGILLNMLDKTKDGPKARADMEFLGIRKKLWATKQTTKLGTGAVRIKTDCPAACYTLSKKEIVSFLECLQGVKVSSGYSANIGRIVDMKTRRVIGMKSHDCHVMITQILPVAIRGLMEPEVRKTILNLCNFFNTISQKSISVTRCHKLQEEIIVILCELEMYFPPAFIDIMVYLMIHIVPEILDLGPVFLHNMYPLERYNGVVKRYVRNRSQPEGSIIQGYVAEECVEFCTDYLADQKSIGVPVSRHTGRLDGEGHARGQKPLHVYNSVPNRSDDYDRAHLVVLQHLTVVHPYLWMHMVKVKKENPKKGEAWLSKEHNANFANWLKNYWYERTPTND